MESCLCVFGHARAEFSTQQCQVYRNYGTDKCVSVKSSMNMSNRKKDNCSPLGYYAASSDNF
jgi:hypothetical protein